MAKIIVRIKGGLGNQLFCYAAARRLSLVNHAELVIDHVTGFVRDRRYRRQYMLDSFCIPARKATPAERLEPFERYRRALLKWWSRQKPFSKRSYLEQEGNDFDRRLLEVRLKGDVYLDGLWQSEGYFKDTEQAIRQDLQIIPPTDALNLQMQDRIRKSRAVAVHVRWFDEPGSSGIHNASDSYYRRAIHLIEEMVDAPHYFLFSNEPQAVREKLLLPEDKSTIVAYNRGDKMAYADLWLMTQCQHFITANSTFSWWGAWLAKHEEKIVLTPGRMSGDVTAWGFEGQIPSSWIQL